jgi:hypothetical protein
LTLVQIFKKKFWQDSFKTFLLFAALISFCLTLFFIQKVNSWNTIQFLYYFLIIFNILVAIAMVVVIRRCNFFIKLIIILIILALSIPTTISTAKMYFGKRPPARLSFPELEALNFLKSQTDGIVLTQGYDESEKQHFDEPVPLFAYDTSAYVSAFSGKVTYFADHNNAEIVGLNISPRKVSQLEFFRTREGDWQKNFLEDNKIGYIYLLKYKNPDLDEDKLNLIKVFENSEVIVYRVKAETTEI